MHSGTNYNLFGSQFTCVQEPQANQLNGTTSSNEEDETQNTLNLLNSSTNQGANHNETSTKETNSNEQLQIFGSSSEINMPSVASQGSNVPLADISTCSELTERAFKNTTLNSEDLEKDSQITIPTNFSRVRIPRVYPEIFKCFFCHTIRNSLEDLKVHLEKKCGIKIKGDYIFERQCKKCNICLEEFDEDLESFDFFAHIENCSNSQLQQIYSQMSDLCKDAKHVESTGPGSSNHFTGLEAWEEEYLTEIVIRESKVVLKREDFTPYFQKLEKFVQDFQPERVSNVEVINLSESESDNEDQTRNHCKRKLGPTGSEAAKKSKIQESVNKQASNRTLTTPQENSGEQDENEDDEVQIIGQVYAFQGDIRTVINIKKE